MSAPRWRRRALVALASLGVAVALAPSGVWALGAKIRRLSSRVWAIG